MHWIYLIHEFHNLSWITEINELFHDILIYWDAPVHQSSLRWHINMNKSKFWQTKFDPVTELLTWALNESLESIRTLRYLYSHTTCSLSPDTKTSGTTLELLVLVKKTKNIHTILEIFNYKKQCSSQAVPWTNESVSSFATCDTLLLCI